MLEPGVGSNVVADYRYSSNIDSGPDRDFYLTHPQSYRFVNKVNQNGQRLRQMFGWSSVSWLDIQNQSIVFRSIGTMK